MTVPVLAPGTATLTGIEHTAGMCECCTRRLTQRVFRVRYPDGTELNLGRRCAAKATGYKVNLVERMAAMAARVAEVQRREAIVAAAYPQLGELFESVNAEAARLRAEGLNPESVRIPGDYHVFQTATTTDDFWTGRNRTAFPTWQAYVDAYITR